MTPKYETLDNGTLHQIDAPHIDYAEAYWGEDGRSTLDDQRWNCHGYLGDKGLTKSESVLQYCKGDTILEIGCAPGSFLKLARDNRFTATGIEPSHKIARQVEKYSGAGVVTGTFPHCCGNRQFDNVVAMDVLEHQHDPVGFVYAIKERLNPGGRMIFMLPALLDDGKFREQDKHPEHVWLFSEKHLRDWLKPTIIDRWIVGHEIVVCDI